MIEVVDYDPAWAHRFEQLKAEYTEALSAADVPVVAIEHVGSTAVPGLAAKPVIDCDIVVERPDVEAATAVLVTLGFAPLGEVGIPERWAFTAPARLARTNTYVIVAGSLHLRNHLAVRDILRADPALRDAYGQLKKRIAATAKDIHEYVAGKNAMVQQILEASGLTEQERASIDSHQIPAREAATRISRQRAADHPARPSRPADQQP
jgi:GrpB-like predicted nucleotidyltransferase (UPF0157 family)